MAVAAAGTGVERVRLREEQLEHVGRQAASIIGVIAPAGAARRDLRLWPGPGVPADDQLMIDIVAVLRAFWLHSISSAGEN